MGGRAEEKVSQHHSFPGVENLFAMQTGQYIVSQSTHSDHVCLLKKQVTLLDNLISPSNMQSDSKARAQLPKYLPVRQ